MIEVFQVMLKLEAKPVTHWEGSAMPAGDLEGLVGSVSFAGKISGVLYLNCTRKLACALTERLIGSRPTDASQPLVIDAIGEITNMITGDMKRRTAALGYNGLLAPPLVIQGRSLFIDPKHAPITSHNLFRIPDLQEDLAVRVFAKLEA